MEKSRVVHESETQRQHVRLPLPARVEVGGREYEIKNLSSGGVGIKGIEGAYSRGQPFPLRLKFSFGTFSLEAGLEAEVQHYDADEKSLGCVFTALTPEHISLINHILKSYLAGDVVASGDLLGVAARHNFATPRKASGGSRTEAPNLRRQIAGVAAVCLIGIALALFILGNLYDSLFVVRAVEAAVSAPTVVLNAESTGTYRLRLDPGVSLVRPGQEIGKIVPTDGTARVVKSPCDCLILDQAVPDGGFAATGQPLLTLVPVDSAPWITARIDPADAGRLGAGAQAAISVFGDETEYTGRVAGMRAGLSDPAQPFAARAVLVKIIPEQKLPAGLAGRPASVSFSTR